MEHRPFFRPLFFILTDGMGWDGMDGWMDGRMDGWTDGWMDGWTYGQMDGRMDGQTGGQTDRCVKVQDIPEETLFNKEFNLSMIIQPIFSFLFWLNQLAVRVNVSQTFSLTKRSTNYLSIFL